MVLIPGLHTLSAVPNVLQSIHTYLNCSMRVWKLKRTRVVTWIDNIALDFLSKHRTVSPEFPSRSLHCFPLHSSHCVHFFPKQCFHPQDCLKRFHFISEWKKELTVFFFAFLLKMRATAAKWQPGLVLILIKWQGQRTDHLVSYLPAMNCFLVSWWIQDQRPLLSSSSC